MSSMLQASKSCTGMYIFYNAKLQNSNSVLLKNSVKNTYKHVPFNALTLTTDVSIDCDSKGLEIIWYKQVGDDYFSRVMIFGCAFLDTNKLD